MGGGGGCVHIHVNTHTYTQVKLVTKTSSRQGVGDTCFLSFWRGASSYPLSPRPRPALKFGKNSNFFIENFDFFPLKIFKISRKKHAAGENFFYKDDPPPFGGGGGMGGFSGRKSPFFFSEFPSFFVHPPPPSQPVPTRPNPSQPVPTRPLGRVGTLGRTGWDGLGRLGTAWDIA